MELEELEKELVNLEREREAIIEACEQKRKEIAEFKCPYKVGDILISTDFKRERIQIAEILYTSWRSGYEYSAYKIKKDGSLYKSPNNIWQPELYVLLEDDE